MPDYKKSSVPDRWLDYSPVGRRMPGTRFIAFKVPSLKFQVPASESFGFQDLLKTLETQNQELGLIIDLTFTVKYYGPTDIPQSCSYIKIPTKGQRVPSDVIILNFKRAVRQFLKENQANDKLIGVHCTHGLNRTGYLVCRYLIDVDGLDPPVAVELFNSCRGHCIEKENYLKDLERGTRRTNQGMDRTREEMATGLALEGLPPPTCPHPGDPAETQPASQEPPPGPRRQRRSKDHKPPQGRQPLLPKPPMLPYVWRPAHQPEAPPPPSAETNKS